jgi:ribosome-binding factor A
MTMVAERRSTGRQYSRLDRVNQALQEVIADELERVADERLELVTVTVTGVKVDPDLRRARVWFDSLGQADEVAGILADHRVALQAAVGRQMRLKRTPELVFSPDPAIAVGTRVEEILRGLHHETGEPPEPEQDGTP